MKFAAAADHAGYVLKKALVDYLRAAGHEVTDFGVDTADRVDYPDYAAKVAQALAAGEAELGLLVCGSGIGMSMAANRFPAVRAAVVEDIFQARLARQHNDANVLCLGARVTGEGNSIAILEEFLAAKFEGGRHAGRVEKLGKLGK